MILMRQVAHVQIPTKILQDMPVKQREIMDTFLGTVNSMRDKKIDAWMRERIPSMKYIPKFFLKYFMKYAVKIEVKQHDA